MAVAKPTLERQLITEVIGGEEYQYYPLGEYVVVAPGVCGSRPTIKGRRLDARWVLGLIRSGETPAQVAGNYRIPEAAIREVVELAAVYDYERSYVRSDQ